MRLRRYYCVGWGGDAGESQGTEEEQRGGKADMRTQP